MQKIVEFKTRTFWSSSIDVDKLNDTIVQYNQQGWLVSQIQPYSNFCGFVCGYVLLEKK
ncbi:hypothetical protein K0504_01335 [Neiella marina]|uniref:DUF4177 domain-containing protein n=1 Tax=Neiella holothuriorum TaxID=2870530 RepID=A0ABS7EBG0_9GAMM|nr:hypothetical protein [Neiella holothuriorum]MBW8189664.1 hypothetical protein [Neiella holothuriorum]